MHFEKGTWFELITFEIGAWFFHVSHCLDMPNISVNLYGNPFVMAWTHTDMPMCGHYLGISFIILCKNTQEANGNNRIYC